MAFGETYILDFDQELPLWSAEIIWVDTDTHTKYWSEKRDIANLLQEEPIDRIDLL